MLVRLYVLFLVVLFGAVKPGFAADLKLSFGTGSAHMEKAALARLTVPWCGHPILIDCEELDLGETVNLGQGHRISLEIRQPVLSFGPKLQLQAGGALSYAQRTYRLEEGLGIFTDPMRIKVKTWSLWADLELQRSLVFGTGESGRPNRQGQLAVGLGVVHSRFHARLRSALLDVKASGEARAAYLRGRFEVDLLRSRAGGPTPRWRAEITGFDNQSWDVTTGVVMAF